MRFDQLLEEYPALYKLHTAGDSYTVVTNISQLCDEPVDVLLRYAIEMVKEAACVGTTLCVLVCWCAGALVCIV